MYGSFEPQFIPQTNYRHKYNHQDKKPDVSLPYSLLDRRNSNNQFTIVKKLLNEFLPVNHPEIQGIRYCRYYSRLHFHRFLNLSTGADLFYTLFQTKRNFL